jgi:hypothetical protein
MEGLSCVDDVGWMATGGDISQVVRKLESLRKREHQLGGKAGDGIRHRKNRGSSLYTQTRPQDAPSPEANNKDTSSERLCQI